MSAPHPRPPGPLGSANRPYLAYGGRPPVAQADIAAPNGPFSQGGQARPAPSGCGDPFACYRAFLDTNDASERSENDVPCDKSGHTCRPLCSQSQGSGCPVRQANGGERAAQCSTVVSFANRPNGLPLATIIERSSLSTLHSHGSRLSLSCRCHHNQSCNAATSVAHSHRTSRNMEESSLHMIQEHANHEQEGNEKIDDLVSPNVGPAMPCSEKSPRRDVPITTQGQKTQHAGPAQQQDLDSDNEGKGLKKLLRGVIQHVRSASRRSISYASLQASPSPDRADDTKAPSTKSEPECRNDSKVSVIGAAAPHNNGVLSFTDYPELTHEPAETWAEDCQRSLNESEASACMIPTIRHVPPDHAGMNDNSTTTSNEVQIPDGVSKRVDKESTCGTLVGPPTGPSTRGRTDESARCTFDGTPVYRSTAPSLFEYDRTRSISFCSTTSTTYSSTVLGIDLDLHHGFAPVDARSSTPAWFGAPGTNLSLDEVAALSPEAIGPATVRSITSSALPLLLPIAAASGIVQPSNATAMSFYSPTGNLIQAQPCGDAASPQGLTHAYYVNALCFAGGEPSARPAALPLPTPPQSSVPLPSHLKQKSQQHHCHTRSQIVPTLGESNRLSSPRGCDGIMRENSGLTPRSGLRRPDSSSSLRKHRRRASSCWPATSFSSSSASAAHAHAHAAGNARSRLAACTPPLRRFSTHRVSKNNWRKEKDAATVTACKMPGNCKPRTIQDADEKTPASRPASGPASAGLGPLAGWTLRVCFCQPGDGETEPDVIAPVGPGSKTQQSQSQALPRVHTELPVSPAGGAGVTVGALEAPAGKSHA